MQRVRLVFRSVSEIVGSTDIGLLVLTDSAEQRQVALPCDRHVLNEFSLRMENNPVVDKLLPEVLWNVIHWQSDLRLEIHIDQLVDGKYQAMLSNVDTLDEIPVSASDAVLLSFVSRGDISILMEESLFMRQSTVYDSQAIGISLPVNTISDEMLQNALDKAVKNENYEMASHLRDEINRRRKASEGDAPEEKKEDEE
ncbi:MAG: bifunctional nuclease family protein [Prevotella sp.]|nr:bifunctional nuclease family protein [Prevotella sp.]